MGNNMNLKDNDKIPAPEERAKSLRKALKWLLIGALGCLGSYILFDSIYEALGCIAGAYLLHILVQWWTTIRIREREKALSDLYEHLDAMVEKRLRGTVSEIRSAIKTSREQPESPYF